MQNFQIFSNFVTSIKTGIIRVLSITMLFLSLCAFTLPTAFCAVASLDSPVAAAPKRVLFINSYSQDFITVPVVIRQVEQELKGIATIQYMFMNTKNIDLDFAIEQTKREFEYIQGKTGYDFDLIITGDDDALDFVRAYRNEYFRGIPVIFENVNSEQKVKETIKSDPLMAGVVEAYPVEETLQIAARLLPQAKQVVIIMDGTPSSLGTYEQILAVKDAFPQLAFHKLITTSYTTEQLRQKLATYGKETILIFNIMSIDGSGKRYDIANGVKFVTESAKIPVFKSDEAGIEDGLLGGCNLSYESVGQKTGIMARQVLTEEETPLQLGYTKGAFNYKFNVQVMKRFNISKSRLPANTVYVDDPPNFYELHGDVLRPAGVFLLVLVIALLLYDRKRNERFNAQLAQTQAEVKAAELANKAKTDFLSRMSHDIRTPLNAIIGLTDLSMDELNNTERMADNLQKIHSSGIILLSLLNDVLDVSRIESGRLVLKPVPYSLTAFVHDVHAMFDQQCKVRKLHFEVRAEGVCEKVLVDKVRFNQIMGNLLTNAVKFTPAGGSISLTIKKWAAEQGKLPCSFIIADTGQGISPQFQKKMFEPFTQELTSDMAVKDGSGLGLAIVKKIVDIMGGSIEVASVPGKGSTFTLHFLLPLAPAEVEKSDQQVLAGTAQQKSQTAAFAGRRILLVEDHPLNAEIASRMLKKRDMLVEWAKNGKIAVDMFQASAPGYYAMILMDVRMPVMDGRQATRQIRDLSRADAKSIPIVAMTADAFDGDVNLSLQSGMNEQLNKPIEPQMLYAMLQRYL